MNDFFEKRINIILVALLLVVCIAIGIPTAITQCQVSTSNYAEETQPSTFVATTKATETTEPTETEVKVEVETIKLKSKTANAKGTSKKSETKKSKETTEPTSTETEPISFATAATGKTKTSYSSQWNKGYLVAIDYPDTNYSCPHIELTDENRDLLERLCMREFGSGGFTGAALIAQAVKNAMAYYGYDDVATVIKNMHYTGKLKNNPTSAVKKAVIYVFDMDKDAIQHRILYMYNPELVQSAFHESQKYICTYKSVRFFDR